LAEMGSRCRGPVEHALSMILGAVAHVRRRGQKVEMAISLMVAFAARDIMSARTRTVVAGKAATVPGVMGATAAATGDVVEAARRRAWEISANRKRRPLTLGRPDVTSSSSTCLTIGQMMTSTSTSPHMAV